MDRVRDYGEFAKAMGAAAIALDKEISDRAIEIYFQCLEDLPIADVSKAFRRTAALAKFFPKSAEVRELCTQAGPLSLEDRAELALRLVEQNNDQWSSVRFEDRTIHAVVERLGGWVKVCDTIRMMDDREYGFWQRDFRVLYKACARDAAQGPETLIGHLEANNRQKGYETSGPTLISCGYTGKRLLGDGDTTQHGPAGLAADRQ